MAESNTLIGIAYNNIFTLLFGERYGKTEKEKAADISKEIRNAYEQLKDPEKRAQVDFFLLQPLPELTITSKGRYDLQVHPEDMIRLALELRLAELSFGQDFREPKISE